MAAIFSIVLLAKLASGYMISQDAVFYRTCLVALYNRAKNIDKDKNQGQQRIEGIALAELITYMEDTHTESNAAPIFTLAELARLYKTRLKLLGGDVSGRFNNTHLKNRILAHQQDLQAYREGRDVLFAFSKDVGAALRQAMDKILMTKPGFCHRPRRLFDGTFLVQSRSFTSDLKIIVSRKAPLNPCDH